MSPDREIPERSEAKPPRGSRGIRTLLGRLARSAAVGTWETLLAVLLVALFAVVFSIVLSRLFPEGSGLADLYGNLIQERRRGSAGNMVSDAATKDAQPPSGPAAVLTRVSRSVKDRPADAVAWKDSLEGIPIEDRHGIQTLARSAATVTIDQAHEMKIGENSLVVFREDDPATASARGASVVLLGGRLEATVAPGRTATPVRIVTGSGVAALRSTGSSSARLAVTANPDNTSTLSVLSGTAELSVGGRSLVLKPDESVTVSRSRIEGAPTRVADPPAAQAPRDGEIETFASSVPQIEFAWEPSPGAERYRLVVSRDAGFTDIVHSGEVSGTRFVHGNLATGSYFWRVSALGGRAESRPSPTRTLRVVQDKAPPSLRVELPREVTGTDRLVVRGVTEPGADLLVASRPIPLSVDGAFETVVSLKPGLNLIVVESIDAAGNSASRSQYVQAKF